MIPVIRMVRVPAPLDHETVQTLMSLAPAEKQIRIRRQRVRQNADNMLVGAALARYLLWQEFQIPYTAKIAYGLHGKPYLADYPDVHFNISHSGQYVVCIVCDRPVGIDIQEIAPYRPEVAASVCNLTEMAQLNVSAEREREFAQIWAKKEAFVKLTGDGIAGGMKDVSFPEQVRLEQFNYGRYIMSAAYLLY